MKDPTEFRQRFAAWKNGKKPYENGRPEPILRIDSSESDFAQRLRSPWRQEIWDWEGSGKAATHKMSSADNIVYPNVQTTKGGGLIDFTHPIWEGVVDPIERAIRNKDYVPMKTEDDAIWAGSNYKKYYPGFKYGKESLPKYRDGKDQFEDTIDFLRRHEGFKDTTYLDGNGIPTIGYGFTDSQLVKKGKINRNDADIRLRKEVEDRELFLSGIKNWDKLSEASKTALRSYYYNYPAGFKDTTKFMKAWNSGDYEEAIRQVDAGMNDPANPGLRRRRILEQLLLMSDPFLTTKRSKFVKQLEDSPAYTGQFKYIKPIQTDYSLTNRSGGKLNAWKGAGSPSYGGVDIRIPNVEEYMTNMNVFNPYKNKKSILPISF